MREKIYQQLIELTNGKVSSLILKKLTTSSLSRKFIQEYTRIYEINTTEVSRDLNNFTSLQDFFTRTLKKDARPIDLNENIFISPVDAKVEAFGIIRDNEIFEVKNKSYSLIDLLGKEEHADKYKKGKYLVLYLSPANYHRIHSPLNTTVIRQYVLGNKSYPVNKMGLTYGKKPISHNYRMISELLYHHNKHIALIKVGAMFVNSIKLTNFSTHWNKGDEVGYFEFGSTVVLLFEDEQIQFTENIQKGHVVNMGEKIATMI